MPESQKCVFLDRDGVLNEDRGKYTYRVEDFFIPEGVDKALQLLKEAGFLLIVITNQAGISKGLYTSGDMDRCHEYLQAETSYMISDFFYSPYHPTITRSLSRQPESLMFERAIGMHNIDAESSWMIGDSERDLIPANHLGIETILVGSDEERTIAGYRANDLFAAVNYIVSNQDSQA